MKKLKINKWTPEELAQLKEGKATGMTNQEIANSLGRTVRAIEVKCQKLRLLSVVAATVEAPKETRDAAYWRGEHNRLAKEVVALRKQQTATEILVGEARSLAPVTYTPPKDCQILRKTGKGRPQSAVLMLSDTHCGAVVKAEQTCGYGNYDFPTFLRRLKRLEESVVSILQDHTTTPVSELVIPILGDCMDGALTHGSEAGQVNTLFSQFYNAGHALSQFIRNLSALVPSVRIYSVVGNHPRLPSQHKMPTKNRFSNLDGFLMAYVQALLRDVPKVNFSLNRQPFTEFKVQGFTFLASHGDHMRGGDKALGIPAHALGRSVSFNSQIRLKMEQDGINYYVLGHFHRPMQIPHALGSILVNGAFVGVDEFGLTESFTPCPPVQKFFLMHPTFGMSATYDLNLSFAKTEGTPYDIPGEFPMQ